MGESAVERPEARTTGQRFEIAALESAVQRARTRLNRFVPSSDLIESLYFGWFDRPYRRATIAVALKTVVVLEREVHFRRLGNPAMHDRDLAAMLDWLDEALQRATLPARRSAFRPHRIRFDSVGSVGPPDVPAAAMPRFAFQDRSSATRHDPAFGDFDLLACLGTGACGVSPRTAAVGEHFRRLAARAAALGIGIVSSANVAPSVPPVDCLGLHPRTLAALVSAEKKREQEPSAGVVPAVADPPEGESWSESLARRSLLRTALDQRNVVAVGRRPPQYGIHPLGASAEASTTRLAMWVHALAGQRLGVIEGWRDLRDGSRLPYAPLVTRPDLVETVAHTALDLLYHTRGLRNFASGAPVAVVIGDAAVSAEDDNRWSRDAAALFKTLVDRQVRFDVIPQSEAVRPGALEGHRAVLVAVGGTDAAQAADDLRASLAAGVRVIAPGDGSLADVRRAVEQLPDPVVGRDLRNPGDFVAYDADGGLASACLVFNGRTTAAQPCCALANLLPDARTLVIKTPSSVMDLRLRDLLTDETFTAGRDRVPLAAHQFRLLVPAAAVGPGRR